MNILFYGTKPYDVETFENQLNNYPELNINFLDSELDDKTVILASGYEAICIFVNCNLNEQLISKLAR